MHISKYPTVMSISSQNHFVINRLIFTLTKNVKQWNQSYNSKEYSIIIIHSMKAIGISISRTIFPTHSINKVWTHNVDFYYTSYSKQKLYKWTCIIFVQLLFLGITFINSNMHCSYLNKCSSIFLPISAKQFHIIPIFSFNKIVNSWIKTRFYMLNSLL